MNFEAETLEPMDAETARRDAEAETMEQMDTETATRERLDAEAETRGWA